MPQVVLERDGLRVQADLSLSDLKELMGIKSPNGNHAVQSPKGEQQTHAQTPSIPIESGYQSFLDAVSERGRRFIHLLKENPSGIEVGALALQLGFHKSAQIGGLTGGGLSPMARKHSIDLSKVYRTEITKVDGKRTLTFYPGELLRTDEKPAV